MKFFRSVMLVAVCLSLALPSVHALALCVNSNGALALTVAVDGVCTGAQATRGNAARPPLEVPGCMAGAVDGCGRCTDVVLGGGIVAVPPPDLSGKGKLSRAANETTGPVDASCGSLPRVLAGETSILPAPLPERTATCGTVVLRL